MREVPPFHVMAVLARAQALAARGVDVVHLEIGEPDFPPPPGVLDAGRRALERLDLKYTAATGLCALRTAIADSYPQPVRPRPRRVLVTPGASGALQLAIALLVAPGDEVLVTDPGYPCIGPLVALCGGVVVPVPVAATGYRLTGAVIERHWGPRTRAVVLATPGNPTGTVHSGVALSEVVRTAERLGGHAIIDETYQGLVYQGTEPASALAASDAVLVVNSFSKRAGMTGWRVGWLVAPESMVEPLDRLAQNLFLATSTPAQHAALAALTPAAVAYVAEQRALLQARRDELADALTGLGLPPVAPAEGAFYLYVDSSRYGEDSLALAHAWLDQAGVAVAPGIDFGTHEAHRRLRFSYAVGRARLQEGIRRLRRIL